MKFREGQRFFVTQEFFSTTLRKYVRPGQKATITRVFPYDYCFLIDGETYEITYSKSRTEGLLSPLEEKEHKMKFEIGDRVAIKNNRYSTILGRAVKPGEKGSVVATSCNGREYYIKLDGEILTTCWREEDLRREETEMKFKVGEIVSSSRRVYCDMLNRWIAPGEKGVITEIYDSSANKYKVKLGGEWRENIFIEENLERDSTSKEKDEREMSDSPETITEAIWKLVEEIKRVSLEIKTLEEERKDTDPLSGRTLPEKIGEAHVDDSSKIIRKYLRKEGYRIFDEKIILKTNELSKLREEYTSLAEEIEKRNDTPNSDDNLR
jgi:hypothetical protein